NTHRVAGVDAGSGKRLGNDHLVPGIQNPGAFNRDVKATDGMPGLFGQRDRPRLGDVARAARAVDCERRGMAVFQFAAHAHQGAYRAVRARSAYRTVAELGQDARDVFAVKAAADHDRNLFAAKPVSGRNHAAMPETPDAVGGPEAITQTIRF